MPSTRPRRPSTRLLALACGLLAVACNRGATPDTAAPEPAAPEPAAPAPEPEPARDPGPAEPGPAEPASALGDGAVADATPVGPPAAQTVTFDDDADPEPTTLVQSAPKRPPMPRFRLFGTREGDGPN